MLSVSDMRYCSVHVLWFDVFIKIQSMYFSQLLITCTDWYFFYFSVQYCSWFFNPHYTYYYIISGCYRFRRLFFPSWLMDTSRLSIRNCSCFSSVSVSPQLLFYPPSLLELVCIISKGRGVQWGLHPCKKKAFFLFVNFAYTGLLLRVFLLVYWHQHFQHFYVDIFQVNTGCIQW